MAGTLSQRSHSQFLHRRPIDAPPFIRPSSLGIGFAGRPFKSRLSQLSDYWFVHKTRGSAPRCHTPLDRLIRDVDGANRDSWIEKCRDTWMAFFITRVQVVQRI